MSLESFRDRFNREVNYVVTFVIKKINLFSDILENRLIFLNKTFVWFYVVIYLMVSFLTSVHLQHFPFIYTLNM